MTSVAIKNVSSPHSLCYKLALQSPDVDKSIFEV